MNFDQSLFRPQVDSIIFDLDGTLWDASGSTAKGWRRIAENLNLSITITADSIRSVSGLPFDQCVETLFPKLSQTHLDLETRLDQAENEEVQNHGGVFYDGVLEYIPVLRKKFRLFIVSNCQEWYLQSFLKHSRLQLYFDDTLCFGQTNLSKTENIRELVRRNSLNKPIYVGDTHWDQHAAFYAKVKFIFASYGFGSINTYRCPSVNTFTEFCDLMLAPQIEKPKVEIRKLIEKEFEQAKQFYNSVHYIQPLDPKSLFYGAFHQSEMVGIVRLALENGILVLRGMQVRDTYQFLGIGTQLIKALESDIRHDDCFCLPYAWLEKFYGQIGFKRIPITNETPHFLVERLAEYQKKHPDLILMKREFLG